MSNAARQAAYRTRRKVQGHFQAKGIPMERIDAWVLADAAHGLRVLAFLSGTTAQEELNGLILAATNAAREKDRKAWSGASLGVVDAGRKSVLQSLTVSIRINPRKASWTPTQS
jgi:hypothetical protein